MVNTPATAKIAMELIRTRFSLSAMETWIIGESDVFDTGVFDSSVSDTNVFDAVITMGVVNGFSWQIVESSIGDSAKDSVEGSTSASGLINCVDSGSPARNGVTVKVRLARAEVAIAGTAIVIWSTPVLGKL
jgi:hypothetical protein